MEWSGLIVVDKNTIIIRKYVSEAGMEVMYISLWSIWSWGDDCLCFFCFHWFPVYNIFVFPLENEDSNDSNNAMMMIRFYSILVSFVERHISLYYFISFQLLFVSIIISRIMYHYRSLCSACRNMNVRSYIHVCCVQSVENSIFLLILFTSID